MSGYPLGWLLRWRSHAAHQARLEFRLALGSVRAEEAERERLRAKAREVGHRIEESPATVGSADSLQRAARFGGRLRAEIEALRGRLDRQDSRVREAEAGAEVAAQTLARAAAEHEALVGHRRRWLEGRRVEREAREEREAEEWLRG